MVIVNSWYYLPNISRKTLEYWYCIFHKSVSLLNYNVLTCDSFVSPSFFLLYVYYSVYATFAFWKGLPGVNVSLSFLFAWEACYVGLAQWSSASTGKQSQNQLSETERKSPCPQKASTDHRHCVQMTNILLVRLRNLH